MPTTLRDGSWGNYALNTLALGVVPLFVTAGLLRLVERWLPPNFFIYIFVVAFFGSGLDEAREFLADETAAGICGSPHPMADALVRLEQASELVSFAGSPATEPLYTINPFMEVGLAALFVTHPPVGARVRRLRELDPDWREKLRAA